MLKKKRVKKIKYATARKPVNLGEIKVSITEEGYFLMECQDDYIALSDKGVSKLYSTLGKWYKPTSLKAK